MIDFKMIFISNINLDICMHIQSVLKMLFQNNRGMHQDEKFIYKETRLQLDYSAKKQGAYFKLDLIVVQ